MVSGRGLQNNNPQGHNQYTGRGFSAHIQGRLVAGIQAKHGEDSASVARDVVARASAVEPRLTSSMVGLAEKHGGKMVALKNRLKGADSLARKIDGDVAEWEAKGHPKSPSEVAADLFDVNRYTMTFDESRYAGQSQKVLDDLRAQGNTLKVKNFWNRPDNPYQGINVQVTGPGGERFELQFHTPASLDAKGAMHGVYEKKRVLPAQAAAEAAALDAQAFKMAAAIPAPPGVPVVS